VRFFFIQLTIKMESVKKISSNKNFEGENRRFSHASSVCACNMNFSVYIPAAAIKNEETRYPIIYYLSGLTCTDLNCVEKSGIQRVANENNVIIVFPDTSPRGLGYPGEADSWDFGVGAGMYVDATQEPWSTGFKMYSYVTAELPAIVQELFPFVDSSRQSIFGHSMGGHGALICALKNPGKYRSVSAFAPIVNPSVVPWGLKAFPKYLGDDVSTWSQYDATELSKNYSGPKIDILIDQGTVDSFLEVQLKPDNFRQAVENNSNINLTLNMREGYDHSYYFIASFMESHIKFHASHF